MKLTANQIWLELKFSKYNHYKVIPRQVVQQSPLNQLRFPSNFGVHFLKSLKPITFK